MNRRSWDLGNWAHTVLFSLHHHLVSDGEHEANIGCLGPLKERWRSLDLEWPTSPSSRRWNDDVIECLLAEAYSDGHRFPVVRDAKRLLYAHFVQCWTCLSTLGKITVRSGTRPPTLANRPDPTRTPSR